MSSKKSPAAPLKPNPLREIFMIYDSNADGFLSSNEFIIAIQAFGLNPSQSEISKYKKQIGRDENGNITFKDFSNFMHDKMSLFESPEDIIDAFRTFDMEGNGLISVEELRHVLMNLGEKLNEQEIDELIKATKVKAQDIDYREFVNRTMKK